MLTVITDRADLHVGERYVIDDIGRHSYLTGHKDLFVGRECILLDRCVRNGNPRRDDGYFFLVFEVIGLEDTEIPPSLVLKTNRLKNNGLYGRANGPVFQCAALRLSKSEAEPQVDDDYDRYDQED